MSMFQNVQAAAALGQQNQVAQSRLQSHIDNRNDEMYRRYAESQRQVNQKAREIFNPTLEKMFGQMMEGSSVGEFLATAVGKKRVSVAEAVKMAEMDAQDNIQKRMLEGAKSAPFMTIGGQTGPTDQGQPPAEGGEASNSPPATAKSPSNVRIPEGTTPQQAAAIQGVASRTAPQRFGYSFPQLKLSQNPYGGLIAENAQTGERFVFSEEALGAMGSAIEAENEAIRADATMTFAKNIKTQSDSNGRFKDAANLIMGDIALEQARKEGLVSDEHYKMFLALGVRPTQKELEQLRKGLITRDQLMKQLSEEKYQARRKQNDNNISFLSNEIAFHDKQILGFMRGSSGGDSDYGGSDPAALQMSEGGMPSVVDNEALTKARNERNNLAMQRSYYAQANSAMFNHNLHGMSNNLLQGIESGSVDRNALLGIMKIAATDVSAISDPERAMRLLPGEVKNSEEFITKMMPAIMRAGESLGWKMDADTVGAFVDLYITDVNDRVSAEAVRERQAKEDNRIAAQPDLTVAGRDYVDQFRPQPSPEAAAPPGSVSGGISTASAMDDKSLTQDEMDAYVAGIPELAALDQDTQAEFLAVQRDQLGEEAFRDYIRGNEDSDLGASSQQMRDDASRAAFDFDKANADAKERMKNSVRERDAGQGMSKPDADADVVITDDLLDRTEPIKSPYEVEPFAVALRRKFEPIIRNLIADANRKQDQSGLSYEVEPFFVSVQNKLDGLLENMVTNAKQQEEMAGRGYETMPATTKFYNDVANVVSNITDFLPKTSEQQFESLVEIITDRNTQSALDANMEEAGKLEDLLRYISENNVRGSEKQYFRREVENLRESIERMGNSSSGYGYYQKAVKDLEKAEMALRWIETGQNPYSSK